MAEVVKSIGTASRDYSTMTAWEADLDNTGIYASGDTALGECYDDSTFDDGAEVTINGGATSGLAKITLSVAAGQRHDGTAGTGARVVLATGHRVIVTVPAAATTHFITIEWLEVHCNSKNFTSVIHLLLGLAGRVPAIRWMLIHDSAVTVAAHTAVAASNRDALVHNSVFYNLIATANDRSVRALDLDADQASGGCFNNTVYRTMGNNIGAGIGIFVNTDSANGKIRNNLSAGNENGTPLAFSFPGAVNLTSSNNLSDDATADDGGGSNHLINQTLADLFVSTTVGSEDLHLKVGSPAINAGVDLGTTPAGVQFDIDNYDRDTTGVTWDIGADEYVATSVFPNEDIVAGSWVPSTGTVLYAMLDDDPVNDTQRAVSSSGASDDSMTLGFPNVETPTGTVTLKIRSRTGS